MDNNAFQRILQGAGFIFLGNIIGMGSSFVMRLTSARFLGSEIYGYIVLGLSVVSICSIFALMGINMGITQQLPRVEKQKQLYGISLGIVLILSLLLVTFLRIGAYPISMAIADAQFQTVFQFFTLAIPFVAIIRLTSGTFRGIEDPIGKVIVSDFLYRGGTAAVVTVSAFIGVSAVKVSQAWFVTMALIALFGIGLLVIRTNWNVCIPLKLYNRSVGLSKHVRIYFELNQNLSYSLLLLSFPLMFSESLRLVLKQSDNFLVGYFLDSSSVGIYDAAFTLSQSVNVVAATFGFLLLPVLSDLHAQSKFSQMAVAYQRVTKWIVLTSLPFYLIIVSFPNKVMGLIFGPEYVIGGTPLVFVATGFYAHLLLGLNGQGLTAIGETRVIPIGNMISILVNIPLNVFLIPIYDITGAAIASAISYVALNIFFTVVLYNRSGLQPFSKQLFYILVTGSVLYGGLAISVTNFYDEFTAILITVAIFIPLYLFISYRIGMTKSDLKLLQETLPDGVSK